MRLAAVAFVVAAVVIACIAIAWAVLGGKL
jgi:hypothetical protein